MELLSAQRLGEMPTLPAGTNVPLAPAIVTQLNEPKPAAPSSSEDAARPAGSVLGLTR